MIKRIFVWKVLEVYILFLEEFDEDCWYYV